MAFILLAALAACVLFGAYSTTANAPGWLRMVGVEIQAVFRDPGTQWMVFLCAGIYFVTFLLLGKNREQKVESRNGAGGKAEIWKAESRNSVIAKGTENLQPSTSSAGVTEGRQTPFRFLLSAFSISALPRAFQPSTFNLRIGGFAACF